VREPPLRHEKAIGESMDRDEKPVRELPPEAALATEADVRARLGHRPAAPDVDLDPKRLVGAVVTAFGDGEHIVLTLRKLRAEVAAVVVVDLGSEDDTVARIREAFPGIEIVELPTERGFGAALNEGARRLSRPYILSLHGDARLRPGALERLLPLVALEPQPVALAACRLADSEGLLERSAGFRPTVRGRWSSWFRDLFPLPWLRRYKRPWRFVPQGRLDVDWASCAAALLKREALEQVGGADERYFLSYGSEDLGLRLRGAGWRVVYDAWARALHFDTVVESRASKRAARRCFWRTYGTLRGVRSLLRM
jgi:GT2 family glycosyltransferase